MKEGVKVWREGLTDAVSTSCLREGNVLQQFSYTLLSWRAGEARLRSAQYEELAPSPQAAGKVPVLPAGDREAPTLPFAARPLGGARAAGWGRSQQHSHAVSALGEGANRTGLTLPMPSSPRPRDMFLAALFS